MYYPTYLLAKFEIKKKNEYHKFSTYNYSHYSCKTNAGDNSPRTMDVTFPMDYEPAIVQHNILDQLFLYSLHEHVQLSGPVKLKGVTYKHDKGSSSPSSQ